METTIKKALSSNSINYRDFYSALQDKGIGNWDDINSTDIIHDYCNEMMRDGIHISHIIAALEKDDPETEDWQIWLGNSMETPTPIYDKQDLVEALGLDEEDLTQRIEIQND